MADEIHTSLCSPLSCWSTNWLPPYLPMEFNQIQTSFIDSPQQQIKYISDQTFMHGGPFDPDQFNDMNPQLPRVSSNPKQPLNFSNNTPFWNPSATSSAPHKFVEPQFDDESSSSNMVKTKKNGTEPASKKRPRTETQRGLPTFKVRKEKLGDRITALQQLVSPFGKTDTASVLHEATEYIKFLHGQVGSLSTPYLKNGHQMHSNGHQMQYQLENSEINAGGMKQDLRGRGLCLVPISIMFAVASETPMDFWAPTIIGSY